MQQLPGVLRLRRATGCVRRAGCSTTASPAPTTGATETGQFIDRYVFPDGELIGCGRIITEVQDAGLEVQHEENFRVHYAKTLAGWCKNLADNWDAASPRSARAPRGSGASTWRARGSRFERNEIQLHHVLATKTDDGRRERLPAAADHVC